MNDAIAQLRQHCVQQGDTTWSCSETGVEDTTFWLRRNWWLGGYIVEKLSSEGNLIHFPLRDTIVESILENKRTNGGCAPGFAGRFVRDFLEIAYHTQVFLGEWEN